MGRLFCSNTWSFCCTPHEALLLRARYERELYSYSKPNVLFSYKPFLDYIQETIWACGPEPFNVTQYKEGTTCVEEEQIIYVWAKNATRLDLPRGVGFKLKGGSHLLLGLHYKGTQDASKEIVPGINVIVTKKKQPKLARVFMMHSSKNDIAPHTTGETTLNIAFS